MVHMRLRGDLARGSGCIEIAEGWNMILLNNTVVEA